MGNIYEFGNAIDWALILVKPSRLTSNTLDTDNSQEYGFSDLIPSKNLTIQMAFAALPRTGDRVFKKGRHGFTRGRVNAIKTTIKVADEIQQSLDGGSPIPAKCYRAWVVVGDEYLITQKTFMYGGDSGSWILDSMGQVVGLGFAGDGDYNMGYYIPISYIYDDIKQRTGAIVTSPELWDW